MKRSFILAGAGASALVLLSAACAVDPESTEESVEESRWKWPTHGHGGHTGTSSSSHSASSSSHASSSSASSSSHSSSSSSSASSSSHSSSGAGAGTASSSSSSVSSSSSSSSSSGGGTVTGGLFTAKNPWNTAVAGETKSSTSDAIINWLSSNGGWGGGAMQMDFSITVLKADSSTPLKTFTTTSSFYTPDCDHVPFPLPATGSIEGESGFECTQGGDCHLLVVHTPTNKLYEMWKANVENGTFYGGCTAVWDLNKTYPASLRGDGCSSADAGGFPIAGMLFTPDEVASGEIDHALRFILPNSRIRGGDVFVHPGSHTTESTSGGADAPPYGVRFRLRADYPLANLPSEGARVIARAMQKYGMFLADGGTVALTGESDKYSTHKYADMDIDSHSLKALAVKDFEVVEMGALVSYDHDCHRN